jgi:hypothetical protein
MGRITHRKRRYYRGRHTRRHKRSRNRRHSGGNNYFTPIPSMRFGVPQTVNDHALNSRMATPHAVSNF